MESIITATNRQTEVKQDQFFAMKDFAKKLEAYLKTFGPDNHLHYERRAHQYDSQGVSNGMQCGPPVLPHEGMLLMAGGLDVC
jgi:hypothetical protein